MSDVTQSELLINALLDGRLDAVEAARVSKRIADDEQLSEMLANFTQQRAVIAELPQYKLKDRFADRVLEIAAAEAAARPMLNRAPASSVDWKKYAMTLAAIAGLLMGMLVYQWTPLSEHDRSTVAVLSPQEKTSPAQGSLINQAIAGEQNKEVLTDSFSDNFAPAKNSPPLLQPLVTDGGLATAPIRSRSSALASGEVSKDVDGTLASERLTANTKQSSAALPTAQLATTGDIAFSGTPMAVPRSFSQTTIDQVWLLEVNERFSQKQLIKALTSNLISVPSELELSSALTLNDMRDDVHPQDVDGIHVAAKPLQMKNALLQLSQSDTVTISAFHLPSQRAKQKAADESPITDKASTVPLSIEAPQRAIAQKLRGNYFAQQAPRPSALVPESFDKLEEKMGIAPHHTEKESNSVENTDRETPSEESDDGTLLHSQTEIEELFPSSILESDPMQNFLILIRNNPPAKK